MTDDQSPGTIGSYGELPWVETPHIDRLAKEGMRFTRAYGAPTCAVSRAMFLTGLQPHAMETLDPLDHKNTYDPSVLPFWPAELRKAGYRTALIGKWHLGGDTGFGRDWDHSAVWIQRLLLGGRQWYFNPLVSTDGKAARHRAGYSTDLYTDYAIRFIRREHDRPWFMWLSFNATHMPALHHRRHREKYTDVPLERPLVLAPAAHSIDYSEATIRNYHRLVLAVDEGIGRIRSALAETGQLDDTVIVFTSDQGFGFGEHGVKGKLAPYDANMRIPLIVRYPPMVPAGSVNDRPIGILDLPPTFLALAGVSLPWKMHGHDAGALLRNPSAAWDHPVLIENFYVSFGSSTDIGRMEGKRLLGVPWWISYREGRFKYIRSLIDDTIEELYDMDSDPGEFYNLAVRPQHASLLARLRQRTLQELERTDAVFAANMPDPRIVTSYPATSYVPPAAK